jgi:hypothetical protein
MQNYRKSAENTDLCRVTGISIAQATIKVKRDGNEKIKDL